MNVKKTWIALTSSALLGACGGLGDDGTGDSLATLPITANAAPAANAGVEQNVSTATLVTLDGSASTDADGDALSYAWTLTSTPVGSAAVLNNQTAALPTFTADVAGAYVASLIVNDGIDSSAAATVTVHATVPNAAPVANAGAARTVARASTVTLDGSASSDANGDALTYAWTMTSAPVGSTAVLSDPNSAQPTFTPNVAGAYVFTLIVNDGTVDSTAATVTITASGGGPR